MRVTMNNAGNMGQLQYQHPYKQYQGSNLNEQISDVNLPSYGGKQH